MTAPTLPVGSEAATPGRAGNKRQRREWLARSVTLTPRGHYALMGYSPKTIDALGGIVWVPVLRLPWYEDKRHEAAS